MYAVRLTTEEFGPFIEKLDGDRKIEAYAIETFHQEFYQTLEGYTPEKTETYHSLIIS